MIKEHILWAGRTLSGIDEFGKWVCTSLDGWFDSPDIRGESIDRANADGEHDMPTYNQARIVVATGSLHAKGHTELHDAGNFLTGALAGLFQVSGHGDAQWGQAKRNSMTKFTPRTETLAKWQVTLKFVDSRKYGVTREEELLAGQSRNLVHYGNYDAAPLVVIKGPLVGGYTLRSNEGRAYRVNAGIPTGSQHSVDMNDGLLRVNGKVQAGLVGQADIWNIPPGLLFGGATLNMALFPDSGSAAGMVYITDTSI